MRDEVAQTNAVEAIRQCVVGLGGTQIEAIESPITGAEGNREFLLHAMFV